jgi:hypothetical protein
MLQPRGRSSPSPPPAGAGEHQAAAGDLAWRQGLGAFAILIGTELEIVAVDSDIFSVLRLHFYIGHNIMSAEFVADQSLDTSSIRVECDVENQVLILTAARAYGLFSGWKPESNA